MAMDETNNGGTRELPRSADAAALAEAATQLNSLAAFRRHEPPWVRNFDNLSHEWRRWFAELVGTFLLVTVAAGGGVVAARVPPGPGHVALVVAPGLMVMAIILATGAVSGAHLNPVVTVAFVLRREFPWRRVPLYLVAQLVGAVLAVLLLWALFGKVGHLGGTLPDPRLGDLRAAAVEALLTFGLVSIILGTASGAQNVGPLSALAVGGYIALAGIWASSVSGASMNPVRSLAPDLFNTHHGQWWIYLVGPTIGMLVAVGAAVILRGRGGDISATRAAQGTLP